jgi:outer membrane receptor protein involved in Fe transport
MANLALPRQTSAKSAGGSQTLFHRILDGARTACLFAGLAAVLWFAAASGEAQENPPEAATTLPPVNVTAAPILPGLPDLEKVPSTAQIFNRGAITRDGYPALLKTLGEGAGGVTVDDAQNNPWQPNLIYRGFEASPLVGDPQGLAVYVNGSRFNQPFGDTTNWDLIPDIAMDRIDLVGSNPAFGLNALGGALAVRMRDGFTYHGAEAELLGGSFGRIQGSFQYGIESNNTSAYIAGTGMHENGWRDFSPSTLRQLYGDVGWRGEAAELHLNIIAADNDLVGNGTTPVDLLDVSRSAIFTFPDETKNKYVRVGLNGTYSVSDQTTIQVNAYYSNLSQRTFNGDAATVEPCDANPSIMCQEGGPPLADRAGGTVPNFVSNSPYVTIFGFSDFAGGGPYAFLNRTATDTNGYGVQVQVDHSFTVLGMTHHLAAGASYDGGSTEFTADTLLGALSLDRGFLGPGISIVAADGSISPVRIHTFNNYYGLYVTDTVDITKRLSGTVSARFNSAQITLHDQLGSDLNGAHSFNRLNPAAGVTYKLTPAISVYAGYAETNRAPTPAELSCADPSAPCSLTNFFVGDPDLKQVVAHTFEAGVRGVHSDGSQTRLEWNVGLFRTNSDDDILFVSAPTVGRAFFRNVGLTRRQGIELGLRFRTERLNVYANYAFTDATFQTALTLNSPDNPFADANGIIHVQPGDKLPGVPRNLFKIGADYNVSPKWVIGFSAIAATGKFLAGDESNLNPTTGAYGVLNVHSSYQITEHFQAFALINNVLNTRYATFGTFSPVTAVPLIQAPGSTNTRSLSLAPPVSAFGGVRAVF